MKKILICEDEVSIREFIVINLERVGYTVTAVGSGEDALRVFGENEYGFSVVLLDVMLPGISGLEVCKEIRKKSETIGIIMLTAKSQETDRVMGLMYGADDYVTKPFSPAELNARVDAAYRRVSLVTKAPEKEKRSDFLTSGIFTLNTRNRLVLKNGKEIELTHIEYRILEFFFKNQNGAIDRHAILKYIWGDDYIGDDKIVDVNIRRLRLKLEEDPANPEHLMTVWGVGYKWVK